MVSVTPAGNSVSSSLHSSSTEFSIVSLSVSFEIAEEIVVSFWEFCTSQPVFINSNSLILIQRACIH